MFIKQVSVFMENAHGHLADFADLMSRNNIDMLALTVADTSTFGIVRAVVSDPERAVQILKVEGYSVTTTDVIAVAVPDHPGGLARVLDRLRQTSINIEYLYSLVRPRSNQAVIILRVDQLETAQDMLSKDGVGMLSQKDLME